MRSSLQGSRCPWLTQWLKPVLVLIVAATSACTTGPITAPTPNTPKVTNAAAPHHVVGRLDLRDGDKPVSMGIFSSVSSAGFVVAVKDSSTGEFLDVSSDGAIDWKLSAGTYDVLAISLTRGSGRSTVHIAGTLVVTEDRATTDIGTISANLASGRISVTPTAMPGAAANTEAQAAESAGDATGNQALRFESTRVGSYRRLTDICSTAWSLACSREYQGVTILSPTVSSGLKGHLSSAADSLRPRLAWKEVGLSGVTYDVVVWRAVMYRPGLMANPEYVQGAVAYYAEGLDRAEAVPTQDLAPGSRYFWSVRLRKGDVASTWSTTGHFLFLLVAVSSSSGQYFAFDTPAAARP